jgi:hypothetical protein
VAAIPARSVIVDGEGGLEGIVSKHRDQRFKRRHVGDRSRNNFIPQA